MKLARINKPIWSTRKVDHLEGVRLLEVDLLSLNNGEADTTGSYTVVCDNVGAGIGEDVLITTGSAVRDVVFSNASPFKTVVTAIIDRVYIDETLIRDKDAFMITEGQ